MGWTSTGDPYVNVGEAGLSFDNEDAAKAFCEKYGWEYVVCAYTIPFHTIIMLIIQKHGYSLSNFFQV